MESVYKILNYSFSFGEEISISVKAILSLIILLMIVSFVVNFIKRIIVRRLDEEDKNKFDTVFSFGRWFLYTIVFLVAINSFGVNITAIFAASAGLLIGIGLALQTFFQDIISGIFIILDKSVRVGDIIELEGKVGRVDEIKLRTTRAVTIDNKVLIIPNHKYLNNSLYNWTQNGSETRESVTIGVAYGSDTELVKELLIEAATQHPSVLKNPPPLVLFTNFGDNALEFKLIFTLDDSFIGGIPKSDIRYTIDKSFRANNITIPFPQRNVHIVNK